MTAPETVVRKTNRLSREKSPYLLQHAHNPVDWYPWGEEAFEKAKAEDKPIFLSIGYSTCHWCHVMERESFEADEVAAVLNRNFVAIKVDREERPDIDHIYMTVCQAMTGGGGWPLTVVMTPDKQPFFAGTYFPRRDRLGMPGLITVLTRLAQAWREQKDELVRSGEAITALLGEPGPAAAEIPEDTAENAFRAFSRGFDPDYGGFGPAPKFPTPHNLYFLLRYWHLTREAAALAMVRKTLDAMAAGGIFDHIGFGFARYSTDRQWLVPHFEKMLYDNALLAVAYLEAFQATREERYAAVARQIFTYVLRDMTAPDGGFYAAEDADSEGAEGKFYVWTPAEVKEVLGTSDGAKFCTYFDITPGGNFEGESIPNLIRTSVPAGEEEFVARCREKLFRHRERRVHPHKDDKILTDWNGLMIAALAAGARILGDATYRAAAVTAVDFIERNLVRPDGRLLARYRDGEAAYPAYAEDYAYLIWGLIELYDTTHDPAYLKKALSFNADLLRYFWDDTGGGLFIYGSDSEQLIARPKEIYDGATPSANSVAALNFLRLARLTGAADLEEKAAQLFSAFGGEIARSALGHSFFLTALLFASSPGKEIIIASETKEAAQEMLETIQSRYLPFTVTLLVTSETADLAATAPFIKDYRTKDGLPTAYVCENFACRAPVTDNAALAAALE
ncbi:MAG: thioredoxin domain-containing protein [bacterium]